MTYSSRAPYYQLEYTEQSDVEFINSFILHRRDRVLEIPCGAGRLSKALARSVDSLTVADIAPSMVALAERAAKSSAPTCKVETEIQDMAHFRGRRRYDLIIVPREAFQLLSHDYATLALSSLSAALEDGGRMLIDLTTFRLDRLGKSELSYFHPNRKDGVSYFNWVKKIDDGKTLTRHSKQVVEVQQISFCFDYQTMNADYIEETWSSSFVLQRFDKKFFSKNLPAELAVESCFGDYEGRTFDENSQRLIIVVRKCTTR